MTSFSRHHTLSMLLFAGTDFSGLQTIMIWNVLTLLILKTACTCVCMMKAGHVGRNVFADPTLPNLEGIHNVFSLVMPFYCMYVFLIS